ncbi:MAG TPA: hypothetical protein DCL77_08965 [Prolixibacteraceae bacterium]|jgi:hypothetical protein|nr:hypothetical protein [Prolixibacteraceae bacterium]
MKPTRSLFLDCLPEDQPEGTYRRARNIVHDRNAKKNEPGMSVLRDLGFYTLHQQAIDDGCYILLGTTTSGSSVGSRIGVLDSAGVFTLKLKTDLLNFMPGSVFKVVYFRNFKGELIVVFTDNINSPKILNLDSLPFTVDQGMAPASAGNFILLEMFGQFFCPDVEFTRHSDSGGQLLSGAYYFCFAYEFPDGSQTNKSQVVGPIMITDDTTAKGVDYYDGCEPGTLTSKSIQITINQLDTRYKFLRIFAIRKVSGVHSAEMVARKEIFADSFTFTYTGGEQADAVSIESILINNPSYTKAKTLTILGKQLHLANLNEDAPINYQLYANNIRLKWVKEEVSISSVRGSYKDEVTIFNKRGFFPDEVMAFYIRFMMLDGSSSPAFHIPGRVATTLNYEGVNIQETAFVSDLIANSPALSFLSHDAKIDPNVKFFHTRETARSDGTMGFWENESEVYPNTDEWGTLKGQKVRHHKFPGIPLVTPTGLESTTTYNISVPIAQRTVTRELGSLISSQTVFQLTSLEGTAATSPLGTWNGKRYTASVKHSINVVGSVNATLTAQNTNSVVMNLSIGMFAVTSEGDYLYTQSGGQTVPRNGFVGTMTSNASASKNVNSTVDLEAGQWVEFTQYISVTNVNYYYYYTEVNLEIKASKIKDFEGFLAPTLGISVSNIYIPQEIKDKVSGFEILYAKRTFNNTRVLGQGAVFHYQKDHASFQTGQLVTGDLGPGIGSMGVPVMSKTVFGQFDPTGSVLDDRTLRFHCFDMLADRIAASPSYIKEQFCLRTEYRDLTYQERVAGVHTPTLKTDNKDQVHFIADFVSGEVEHLSHYSQVRQLRKVNSFKYIPGDTLLQADGLILNNYLGEGHAYANIEQDGEPTNQLGATAYGWGTGGGFLDIADYLNPGGNLLELMVGALYQHRSDVYNNLYSQELVSTGQFVRLSGFYTYQVPEVFGGDTYICPFATRLTAPLCLSFALAPEETKPEEKFIAIKAIYNFPVYSVHNISLRHSGVLPKDSYYPKVGTTFDDYRTWLRRSVDISNDNTFFYNRDYTSVNDLTRAFPFSTSESFAAKFPYRIIRANPYVTESKEFSMREFLPLNYYELPNTRGEIVNIEAVGDILYINTRASVYRTLGSETMETSSGQVALGVGDIFRVPPKEMITSENGYAGCQHMSSCYLSKLGYLFTDAEQGKIFLISAQLDEISNKGLRNFFISKLKPIGANLTDQFCTAFDEDLNRLIVKLPTGDTLSYCPDVAGWLSMHDYSPDRMSSSRRGVVSIKGTKVYKHNLVNNPGKFYDSVVFPSVIDICFNPSPNETTLFASFNWRSVVINNALVSMPRETFSKAMVYDDARCSGEIDLVWMQNIRSAEGEFRFNNFRDMVKNQTHPFLTPLGGVIAVNIDTGKPWMNQRRFVGTHVILRLTYSNISQNTIYLYSADVNYRLSAR